MLDHVHIFHRGGLVLWSKSYVSTQSPVNNFIKQALIEQNFETTKLFQDENDHQITKRGKDNDNDDGDRFGSGGTQEIRLGSYSLSWNFANRFELVFVVVYQRILQLSYITELLESINSLFISLYAPVLEAEFKPLEILNAGGLLKRSKDGIRGLFEGWDQAFNQILKDVERMAGGRRGGGGVGGGIGGIGSGTQKHSIALEKFAEREATVNGVPTDLNGSTTATTTATDSETIARNIAALKARKKKQSSTQNSKNNSRAGSRSGTDSESIPNGSKKKSSRKWDDGKITKDDIAEYDFSEHPEDNLRPSSSKNNGALVDLNSMGKRNQGGLYEVADYDQGERRASGRDNQPKTIFSKLMSSIPFLSSKSSGPITLKKADVRPILDQIQTQLMKKNVAREIAVKVCDRIELDLIGKRLEDPSKNLKDLIYQSLESSLTKILTPRSSTDLISEIYEKKDRSQRSLIRPSDQTSSNEPFVMTFVGVNGVGKSTNLSKVAFWLIQNQFKVLIAACDTFRSGAVEQLRTHVKNLGQLDQNLGSSKGSGDSKMIDLYEKGYGKDAAGIAKDAIRYAKNNRYDVVLIDTAGRMQDNEPLMRSLGKLINVNQPDKIVFVGEALVGNEAVDQLLKFNSSIKDFGRGDLGSRFEGRGIDGIILTKFDTIDDKVGAALSMTFITCQPILFVGTGQTYTDLKSLRVNHVVDALLRE